jgi:CcmD family protein
VTLRDAVPYVAAAYLAVWVVILLYVGIIGRKLGRIERQLDELAPPPGDGEPRP